MLKNKTGPGRLGVLDGPCNFKYEGITGKMTIKLRLGEGETMSWGRPGQSRPVRGNTSTEAPQRWWAADLKHADHPWCLEVREGESWTILDITFKNQKLLKQNFPQIRNPGKIPD